MPTTKKVVLAAPYTDADGIDHKADKSVDLPRHEANRLLDAGLARLPEKAAKKAAPSATSTTDPEKGN